MMWLLSLIIIIFTIDFVHLCDAFFTAALLEHYQGASYLSDSRLNGNPLDYFFLTQDVRISETIVHRDPQMARNCMKVMLAVVFGTKGSCILNSDCYNLVQKQIHVPIYKNLSWDYVMHVIYSLWFHISRSEKRRKPGCK